MTKGTGLEHKQQKTKRKKTVTGVTAHFVFSMWLWSLSAYVRICLQSSPPYPKRFYLFCLVKVTSPARFWGKYASVNVWREKMRNVSDESQTLEQIQRVTRGMRYNHKRLVNCSSDLLKSKLRRHRSINSLHRAFYTESTLLRDFFLLIIAYYIIMIWGEKEILSTIFYTVQPSEDIDLRVSQKTLLSKDKLLLTIFCYVTNNMWHY